MAGYAIYIPNHHGGNLDCLREVGLEQLLAEGDSSPEANDVLAGGPDGGNGVLIAWRKGDPATDPPMTPESLDWTPAVPDPERELEAGRFYIGIDPARPVTPTDIARPKPMAGSFLELADGQAWRIPHARFLPHTCGLDASGHFARQVDPRFEAFWQASEQHAAQVFEALDLADVVRQVKPNEAPSEMDVTIVLEDSWRYCIDALAFNYRINADIATHLGIIDDTAISNIVFVTIDLPSVTEVRNQKKTELPVTIPVG
jgi:hypothetical protein